MKDLAVWIVPFVGMIFVMIGILIRFPQLALFLGR